MRILGLPVIHTHKRGLCGKNLVRPIPRTAHQTVAPTLQLPSLLKKMQNYAWSGTQKMRLCDYNSTLHQIRIWGTVGLKPKRGHKTLVRWCIRAGKKKWVKYRQHLRKNPSAIRAHALPWVQPLRGTGKNKGVGGLKLAGSQRGGNGQQGGKGECEVKVP